MEKVWFKQYQDGVAHEIDVNEYKNIPHILDKAFIDYADKPAFTCMGKTFTYKEIDYLSKKFGSYLQNQMGLKKGDRVALMMPNILQYPIALMGVLRTGMIAVNVNPLYTAKELEHQMNDAGVETIVIFENSAAVLEKIIKNTKVKNVITTGIGDLLGFPKSMIVNFVIKHVKKMVPAWSLNSYKFNDVLADGDEKGFEAADISLDDVAFLQYTGGTTGVSKGAVLTHKNIVANMLQAREWVGPVLTPGNEVLITPLPLYHIFSLTANFFLFSSIGAQNILITNPKDIPDFVKTLGKYNFTFITGVNTLFNALLNNDDFKKLDFSHIKIALGGGMAVQKAVAAKWKEVTGKPLVEAYGLTETSPAACINPLNIPEYNGKIGVPISSTDVKILDDEEKEVAIGENGEIAIKGPQVMQGYWQKPEETAKVMTADGYFKTGDIGYQDDKGFFQIVDRKKDMILVSGFNVYPNEIEDVVAAHPKVLECAAVGVACEKSGEAVKLFIVAKDKSLTEDEVKDFCKNELTNYKRPKYVEFRNELPKSNVGKILRKELRDKK